MEDAAVVFGAKHTFFLVNGSTVGTSRPSARRLPGTACAAGATATVPSTTRWRSTAQALFIYPQTNLRYRSPPPCPSRKLKRHRAAPGRAGVIVTCPTYEGVMSDLTEIIALAHRHGLTVRTRRWRAPRLFTVLHRRGRRRADIVIQSPTRPCLLTQTALAHVRSPALASEMRGSRRV